MVGCSQSAIKPTGRSLLYVTELLHWVQGSIHERDFIRLDDREASPNPGAAEHASRVGDRIRKKKPATIGDVSQRL
jgi:hypothetical protein